jgi:hypothetical protein
MTRSVAARRARLFASLLGILELCACTARPLHVGIVFTTSWQFAGERFSPQEADQVKAGAIDSLRAAFYGFAVRVDGDAAAPHLIRVENTPTDRDRGAVANPGAVGLTLLFAAASSVRVDSLYLAELAAANCASASDCRLTRQQLIAGLARGIGATAAHELGHQVGLEFSTDAVCDDCYDGAGAATYAHFFGHEHWSKGALAIMRRVLPPDPDHIARSPSRQGAKVDVSTTTSRLASIALIPGASHGHVVLQHDLRRGDDAAYGRRLDVHAIADVEIGEEGRLAAMHNRRVGRNDDDLAVHGDRQPDCVDRSDEAFDLLPGVAVGIFSEIGVVTAHVHRDLAYLAGLHAVQRQGRVDARSGEPERHRPRGHLNGEGAVGADT